MKNEIFDSKWIFLNFIKPSYWQAQLLVRNFSYHFPFAPIFSYFRWYRNAYQNKNRRWHHFKCNRGKSTIPQLHRYIYPYLIWTEVAIGHCRVDEKFELSRVLVQKSAVKRPRSPLPSQLSSSLSKQTKSPPKGKRNLENDAKIEITKKILAFDESVGTSTATSSLLKPPKQQNQAISGSPTKIIETNK